MRADRKPSFHNFSPLVILMCSFMIGNEEELVKEEEEKRRRPVEKAFTSRSAHRYVAFSSFL